MFITQLTIVKMTLYWVNFYLLHVLLCHSKNLVCAHGMNYFYFIREGLLKDLKQTNALKTLESKILIQENWTKRKNENNKMLPAALKISKRGFFINSRLTYM